MNVTLIPSNEFSRQFKRLAKKYKSFGEDYLNLKKELMDNPFQGDDLGGGVRKIRMAISSKGKVTVKKGTPKGKYVLTISVHAAGDKTYKSCLKSTKVTVNVKK